MKTGKFQIYVTALRDRRAFTDFLLAQPLSLLPVIVTGIHRSRSTLLSSSLSFNTITFVLVFPLFNYLYFFFFFFFFWGGGGDGSLKSLC